MTILLPLQLKYITERFICKPINKSKYSEFQHLTKCHLCDRIDSVMEMFEKDNLIAEILDVFYIERPKNKSNAAKRPFHVLSRRLNGKAVFYQKNKQFPVSANSILYIPSDITYGQESDGDESLIAIHLNILNH